ncbi:thymidylate synthase [Acinetobacter phage Acj9]|uniref:thymidylate synthase n=1 Tax=Acinetobacter phage Acj9 TaxID=760939 RepID=E5EQ15_9CAUD|nr:thymidylate synthase [Acinetobacter phage Acj9]ADG60131.1 Td dTMP synthase [Acinetobacter phage Acj9]
MQQYHDLMQKILDEGDLIETERTGTGTLSIFGEQLKFDLADYFPAITTKKLAWKAVVSELLWFLKGSSNLNELRAILHGEENRFNEEKKTIWDGNYNKQAKDLGYTDGEMGDIYGAQWRSFGRKTLQIEDENCKVVCYDDYEVKGVDQVKLVLDEAKRNPSSRRLIVQAWNPDVVWNSKKTKVGHTMIIGGNEAALPPCHLMYQLRIVNGRLDMSWSQRSNDIFLGVCFNIASYALLQHIFARILGLKVGKLTGFLGDCHIYLNHVDQVKLQLSRDHLSKPQLEINPALKTLEDFENATVDDFKLVGLITHGAIKADMAV